MNILPQAHVRTIKGVFPVVAYALAERAGECCMARAQRLLERVRAAPRTRHYSRRTKAAYVGWNQRFILFHDKRYPA
jgi:hypothetical protein